MKLSSLVWIALPCALVFSAWVVQPRNAQSRSPQVVVSPQPSATPVGVEEFRYACVQGKTALESLELAGYTFTYTQLSFGKLVTSIQGVSQADGKYWLYTVDGHEASVGADAYQCQGQEQIVWQRK